MTSQFLWGLPGRPDPETFRPRRSGWWEQYSHTLTIGARARLELYESCRKLIGLLPDPETWGQSPTVFRGLVVGAVQSGKTGSMIGLTAMALDQGYKVVVVLSGNKDDLRRQTARRFNVQLLRRSEEIPESGGARTLDPRQSLGALYAYSLPFHLDAHQDASLHTELQRALGGGHPAVLVVKKHVTSLAEVRRKVEIAYRRFGIPALPTVIIDDECDDSSVDREGMPIPAAIAGLWQRDGERPRIAYVGYTATSAANLLQQSDNELFPGELVYLLRYPGDQESVLSFADADADNWYTGGQTYYEDFGDEPGPRDNCLIVPSVEDAHLRGPVEQNPSLTDAIRAYVVAGAYRLALRREWGFDSQATCPSPHTMLIQTSASQADHRLWFDGLRQMFEGAPGRQSGEGRWMPGTVTRSLEADEAAWERWYEEYSWARERLLAERPRTRGGGVATWNLVKQEIAPFVEALRIKVVNSDEELATDLDFAPRITAEGEWRRPQDVFVIVIGGAKLSRGLTIEGLCTTYFTRWNPNPTEDTVLQLSRWFGYRGPYLEFCRLVTTRGIYRELRGMHSNDTNLREQLAGLMVEEKSPADAALIIAANPRALPTGKLGIARVCDLSYSPFTTVFHHVECTDASMSTLNEETATRLVEEIQSRSPERVSAASGALHGLVSRDWTALDVARVLESFQYFDHNPSQVANPANRFFRVPDSTRPITSNRELDADQYQIAAYLREWSNAGGAPLFNVGVAYGEMREETAPFNIPLVNREIVAGGEVVGGWTGRRAGWRGDQLFDDPHGRLVVQGTTERREGSNGLLLLYLVHKAALGRQGRGLARNSHTPFFGIVIPQGGPRWRRVTVDHRRLVTE